MIIIDLGYEICDMRCAFYNLEGYNRFVITSCYIRVIILEYLNLNININIAHKYLFH
jgi:hypothetical protein